MGFLKIKQPVLESGRAIAPVQNLTAASTATAITPTGITVISSSAAKVYRIATPPRAGVVKEIVLRNTAAAAKIQVRANSTAQVFDGSTFKTVFAATGTQAKIRPSVRLYARTTTSWTVLSKTTGISLV